MHVYLHAEFSSNIVYDPELIWKYPKHGVFFDSNQTWFCFTKLYFFRRLTYTP